MGFHRCEYHLRRDLNLNDRNLYCLNILQITVGGDFDVNFLCFVFYGFLIVY